MLRTVIAGLNGSPESLAAADWAAREALLREEPLRLVHAWQAQPLVLAPLAGVYAPPPGSEPERQWAERMSCEVVAGLARRHPELPVTADQVAEQPVPALLEAAREAELLVLGSRGLGGLGGFLVGSVAFAVLARAERPVVLVRAKERQDEPRPDATGTPTTSAPYGDVVLGLDLRKPADPVIEFAFDAAARRGAPLRVVHGWSVPPFYEYGTASGPEATSVLAALERNRLAEVLGPWQEKFPGVEVSPQPVIGGAGRHLVDVSRDASLVVVGSRIRRSPVGSHIGAVTHAVLHHAKAPVAVVPHG
ncbi:stress-inducible protein [Streptomyces sp. MMG1533]|uniref:universal stress protein n=1 Tax=Streptomyces sp. MMG1533 TaxID=1415546 RepID=UPI0006AE4BA5|nr:universal stress protein [Streptomyces sp. MMG1533]KOU58105.1 stress-inducible protein [Streptomyces sp. MMG1533]